MIVCSKYAISRQPPCTYNLQCCEDGTVKACCHGTCASGFLDGLDDLNDSEDVLSTTASETSITSSEIVTISSTTLEASTGTSPTAATPTTLATTTTTESSRNLKFALKLPDLTSKTWYLP